MIKITRRNFIRGIGGLAGIANLIIVPTTLYSNDNSKNIKLEKDWDEAIKENNLREEVSGLMKETNFSVDYRKSFSSSVRRINYKEIIGFDMHVEGLTEIKNRLEGYRNISKKFPGAGMIWIEGA